MDSYDIKIPKWMVWAAPILFAATFALIFTVITDLTRLPHCSEFATQSDAQRLLLADPIKYAYLDRNENDVACDGI